MKGERGDQRYLLFTSIRPLPPGIAACVHPVPLEQTEGDGGGDLGVLLQAPQAVGEPVGSVGEVETDLLTAIPDPLRTTMLL